VGSDLILTLQLAGPESRVLCLLQKRTAVAIYSRLSETGDVWLLPAVVVNVFSQLRQDPLEIESRILADTLSVRGVFIVRDLPTGQVRSGRERRGEGERDRGGRPLWLVGES
jgi:hypothetical protein